MSTPAPPPDPAVAAYQSGGLSIPAMQALTGVGTVMAVGGSLDYIDVTGADVAHPAGALDAPTRPPYAPS